jgi:hypothetical protein
MAFSTATSHAHMQVGSVAKFFDIISTNLLHSFLIFVDTTSGIPKSNKKMTCIFVTRLFDIFLTFPTACISLHDKALVAVGLFQARQKEISDKFFTVLRVVANKNIIYTYKIMTQSFDNGNYAARNFSHLHFLMLQTYL